MKVRNFINVMLLGAMCVGFVACEKEYPQIDDNDTEQTKPSDGNNENNSIHNGHEYVDLGLPSGTLWATCNVGADSPEKVGDFFAWGETVPKEIYTWETYKYYVNNITKYTDVYADGGGDGLRILEAEDDAATANWGGAWRTPTIEECSELGDSCTWTWTNKNGKDGCVVKGKNGNSIFLPFNEGMHSGSDFYYAEGIGSYWSSSLSFGVTHLVDVLSFARGGYNWAGANYLRHQGLPVRAVLSKK